jgi:hypothetical protein
LKTRLLRLQTALIGLALSCSAAHASPSWRVGGSYVQPTSESTRDMVGVGWGISGEYSFTCQQEPDDRWEGDTALVVSYRRFENNTATAESTVDWTTIGLKWRNGRGASPACPGLYAGLGVGAAILRIQPGFNELDRQSVTKLEWNILGGANLGNRVYVEIMYSQIPDISYVPLRNLGVTVGFRF